MVIHEQVGQITHDQVAGLWIDRQGFAPAFAPPGKQGCRPGKTL